MTGKQIIEAVKKLELPKGEFIVFGSCPLAIAGIRDSGDVDMLVSDALLEQLRAIGWQQIEKAPDDKPYVFEEFEAHNSWDFSSYAPTLAQLLETATWIQHIPFASLEEVRKWKAASGRPKDLIDIKLIDNYLKKQS